MATDVESLYKQAVIADLSGADFIAAFGNEELAAAYNGIGPACMSEKRRKELTKWLKLFEPACLIHDMRYECSDGSRMGFDAANVELKDNCIKLANYTYPWWNWKRYRARFVARVMYAAVCTNAAWKTWMASRK